MLCLDPEAVAFDKVIDAALAVKEVLDMAGASSFTKTSGATGMHIYVPVIAKDSYEVAKNFAHLIALVAHQGTTAYTSLERSPTRRQKRVYLDYLQNRFGQTLAAPYSTRPRRGATVFAPLRWEEIRPGLDPSSFTLATIGKRLEKHGDLFKGVLGAGINIEKCIKNLEAKI